MPITSSYYKTTFLILYGLFSPLLTLVYCISGKLSTFLCILFIRQIKPKLRRRGVRCETLRGEYALSFEKESCAKKTCWRSLLERRCLIFPPVDWIRVAKTRTRLKYAAKKNSLAQASLTNGFFLCGYAADAAMPVCDSHFRRYMLFQTTKTSIGMFYFVTRQPKHKLQGSGCAADRASRSDDETGGKRSDQACLILTNSLLFHKPLKLTLYRPG